MENTVKKKGNENKGKKKSNDIKERILSGRPVLCFDEEIEFNKCCSIGANVVEDTTEKKKKNTKTDNNNNASVKGTETNKKKSQKKNEKGKIDSIHKSAKNKEKTKKTGETQNSNSNSKHNGAEDEGNIYKNKHRDNTLNEEEMDINKNDSYNALDSSTNSSTSPRIHRNNNDIKKKHSSKMVKMQTSNNNIIISEENNEQLNKWIEYIPNIDVEIENILSNQLPCYNILSNIKRINKIKHITYNENDNDNCEMLNSIEKSNLMFNSIKLSTKEKYIIRFLCEGSSYNISQLVELLYYVLNNDELTLDKFPIKISNNGNTTVRTTTFLITSNATEEKEKHNDGNNIIKDCSLSGELDNKKGFTESSNNEIGIGDRNDNPSNSNDNNLSLDNFSDEENCSDDAESEKKNYNICISKEELFSCIPILLSRKNLGDNMKKVNVSKNENNEKECLWVWENDNYDIFPSYYKEIFKYFKELRSNISKMYKTLIKLKSSIVCKDLQNVIKIYDYLNELKKKQYMESEKRGKRILVEKKKIMKKKMEIKKQEEKKKKNEDAKCVEENKTATIVKLDSAISQNKVEEKKPKQQNLILSWLTLKKSQTVNTFSANDNGEQNVKYPIVNVLNFNEEHKDKLLEVQNQLPIFTCGRRDSNESSDLFQENAYMDKQKLLTDYVNLCENHKRAVVDYFRVYVDNKEFVEEIPSVDSIDGSKLITQNEKGVRSKLWEDNEFYLKLKNSDYVRSFFFYDNSWTRPYMSLLVHKVLDDNLNLLPFYYHDDMEYENDTNEDYYEKFETIDLTTENEENETESDGSSQDMFIVPDNEINTDIEITPITIPTSQDIHFFSLFNWQWTFEGNSKRNYSIIDKNTWKEFNLICKENMYGCQYMTWGKENNPFKYLSERNSLKNTLDIYDIKKLIKHSHGKVTKKDVLVEQFKIKNEHLTKADTERKFKMYLSYKKCEDNRKKWMASEEGIKLFKNEELLTKIYDMRKRKLSLMSQKIEAVKRQKKMDKDNLKKEEKIKKKEKINLEKQSFKESSKKEENEKDQEKVEKKELVTKSELTNTVQKLSSNSLLVRTKKVKK
ncbi:conserved Plasmodium protein, unknown function [Plasmodium ovale]|uniref:Uncharacterized protein n=2 Tax=Plasmodium ovale TaxID=36330 RepID=A0A1A8W8Y6_PLAOA|nr:conserved Plasmodium protein, unknown function [Plasmodium ovale curtisi]SBS98086.1 conserved Plasmodium protein, unknown function [Plasmodium ovale curtisi]SCQ16836.1 conserved Plasmodium protein, unknown function [Plasmodium ovale]